MPVKEINIYPVVTKAQTTATAELADRIWREHYTQIIGIKQVEYMLARFQSPDRIWQDIAENGFEYSLAEADGELAGYMAVRPDEQARSLYLSKFYIDHNFRRQGLGRKMLDLLTARCLDSGLKSIWLTVNKNNIQSIAAYHKLGFIQTGSVVNDIGAGYVTDDYVMRLQLA